MSNLQDVVRVWSEYLDTVKNWETHVEGLEPKEVGCGLVFELLNPLDRPGESFAIADMRKLELAEPHKHIGGEVEIYYVLQGVGRIAVGSEIQNIGPGDVIVTPSDTVHITLPGEGLVLAVVNTPPFKADNYVLADMDDVAVATTISNLRSA